METRQQIEPAIPRDSNPNTKKPQNLSPQKGFNAKQLKMFQIGLLVAVLMGIFPPWVDNFSIDLNGTNMHSQGSAGYGFILNPPTAAAWHTISLDFGRLCIQWLVVGLAVGAGVLNFKEPNTK